MGQGLRLCAGVKGRAGEAGSCSGMQRTRFRSS